MSGKAVVLSHSSHIDATGTIDLDRLGRRRDVTRMLADETQPFLLPPAIEYTTELPTAELLRAMRHYRDERLAMLRRVALCYVAIGCVLLFSGFILSMLEVTGIRTISMPTVEHGSIASFNGHEIVPAQSSASRLPAMTLVTSSTEMKRHDQTSSMTLPSLMESSNEPTMAQATIQSTDQVVGANHVSATASVVQVQIPSIAVSAPVAVLGVDADGAMQSPGDPATVAWYDFSSNPRQDGNAVFAGHLDFTGSGPAVFWRLSELIEGDEIVVVLSDGVSVQYSVTAKTTVAADANAATFQHIIGPTANPSLTLITCTGDFDPETLEYSKRLIVRAERRQTTSGTHTAPGPYRT